LTYSSEATQADRPSLVIVVIT